MKLSLVERETILLYNQAEPMAEVYTHDPRLMEKLELLAKKHPDQIDVYKRQGRYSDRYHPECQRPFEQPRGGKYL